MAATAQSMELILVNPQQGRHATIVVTGWLWRLLSLCLVGAPVVLGCLGYQLAVGAPAAKASLTVQPGAEAVSGPLTATGADTDARGSPVPDHPAAHGSAPTAFLTAAPAIPALPPSGDARIVYAHGRTVDPAAYQRRSHH